MADATTTAPFIEIPSMVFPVGAMRTDGQVELTKPDFFGTAFAVAPGIFMTAAHVVATAAAAGRPVLAFPRDERAPIVGAPIDRWEVFPDLDIALLWARTPEITVLNRWITNRVPLLTDLSSFGYPHAVTRENNHEHFRVLFRGYKGHVITTRGFERLRNRPTIYEVSSAYPQGMSGGPVLYTEGNQLVVAGVVIGVAEVEYEAVSQRVGIAMMSEEILRIVSTALGGPIGAQLNLERATVRFGTRRDESAT